MAKKKIVPMPLLSATGHLFTSISAHRLLIRLTHRISIPLNRSQAFTCPQLVRSESVVLQAITLENNADIRQTSVFASECSHESSHRRGCLLRYFSFSYPNHHNDAHNASNVVMAGGGIPGATRGCDTETRADSRMAESAVL